MTEEQFNNLKVGDIIIALRKDRHVITKVVNKGMYRVKNLKNNLLGSAFIASHWTLDESINIVCI